MRGQPIARQLRASSRRRLSRGVCRLNSMTVSASAAGPAAAAPRQQRNVAVIGAGAAGLVSIRELLKEGHQVVGFELGSQPGGTWVYDPNTDSDILGADSNRRKVHSSMYRDLRSNLPREIMGYLDAPFTPAYMGSASRDPRRYPGHAEVLSYLQCFADRHALHQHIQYSTQVVAATPLSAVQHGPDSSSHDSSSAAGTGDSIGSNPAWQVSSVPLGPEGRPCGQQQQQVFDAVVVCCGQYSEPNLPNVPGAGSWPGLQMHSHNYRCPEAFAGQTVVVVGASNSGDDVFRQVAEVADQVILSARSWKDPECAADAANPRPFGPRGNVTRRGMVSGLHPDGRVEFSQGPELQHADTIIYCTGYVYRYRFLEGHPSTAHLSGQQHVPGLYQHMFVPALGHSLAFVGVPWKVVPWPLFQLQATLVARLLSGRAELPPQADQEAAVEQHYQWLREVGRPLRYCHMLDALQWPYDDWLVQAAGADVPPLSETWRPAMYGASRVNRSSHPEDYRDRWEDAAVVAAAEEEFKQLLPQSNTSVMEVVC